MTAIATLFSLLADKVECVLLNACYSATQADAIAEHIPFAVEMKRALGDRATPARPVSIEIVLVESQSNRLLINPAYFISNPPNISASCTIASESP
jgi:hypothetical protein